jgi:dUTP pyrophosphatase
MVIDSDYRGEIMVALYNDSGLDQELKAGDRIAQLIFHEQCTLIPDQEGNIWQIVENLSDTERSDGGFGSTGTN